MVRFRTGDLAAVSNIAPFSALRAVSRILFLLMMQ